MFLEDVLSGPSIWTGFILTRITPKRNKTDRTFRAPNLRSSNPKTIFHVLFLAQHTLLMQSLPLALPLVFSLTCKLQQLFFFRFSESRAWRSLYLFPILRLAWERICICEIRSFAYKFTPLYDGLSIYVCAYFRICFAITQFDNGVKWEKHNAPAL